MHRTLERLLATLRPGLVATALALMATQAQAGESTNKIGITMVDIPAGSFLMGSCKGVPAMPEEKRGWWEEKPVRTASCGTVDALADDDEAPQHRVSIRAFQMGKTEVTLAQFKQFIAATGRNEPTEQFLNYNAFGDEAPVVRVSWYDIQGFIAWLNSIDGGGYRLPTEAEWEYACRAGGKHAFCGGDNVEEVAWYLGNASDRPHPVARKQPNAFGLFDMSGNAAEYTQDCWHYTYRGAPNDGSAWMSGCEGDARRVRGGSFGTNAKNTRAAARLLFTAGERPELIGFRLVRSR